MSHNFGSSLPDFGERYSLSDTIRSREHSNSVIEPPALSGIGKLLLLASTAGQRCNPVHYAMFTHSQLSEPHQKSFSDIRSLWTSNHLSDICRCLESWNWIRALKIKEGLDRSSNHLFLTDNFILTGIDKYQVASSIATHSLKLRWHLIHHPPQWQREQWTHVFPKNTLVPTEIYGNHEYEDKEL